MCYLLVVCNVFENCTLIWKFSHLKLKPLLFLCGKKDTVTFILQMSVCSWLCELISVYNMVHYFRIVIKKLSKKLTNFLRSITVLLRHSFLLVSSYAILSPVSNFSFSVVTRPKTWNPSFWVLYEEHRENFRIVFVSFPSYLKTRLPLFSVLCLTLYAGG